jgi:hypothetical protein
MEFYYVYNKYNMESIDLCCLCHDFIDVPVGGSVTAPLPLPPNGIRLNENITGFVVNDLNLNFTSTPSGLFRGLTVTLNGVQLKLYVVSQDIITNPNINIIVELRNRLLINILDENGAPIAIATIEVIANSSADQLVGNNGRDINLVRVDPIRNINGYFNGYVTLTGNGLLKLLPPSVSLNTQCDEVNNAFSSLYTTVINVIKKYGNSPITHSLCDVVVKIPSLILAISDLLKSSCFSKCKTKLSEKISDVINRIRSAIVNVGVPESNNGTITFNLKFIYEINKSLSVLNKLLECDLADLLCNESSDSCEDQSSSDPSDPSDKNPKDNNKLDVIVKKISNLEKESNKVEKLTNETKKNLVDIKTKVSQQDKIVKKVAECVIKK